MKLIISSVYLFAIVAQVMGQTDDCADGLHPNPTDCNKFLSCANGKQWIMDCPAGLHFNPELLVCDWPENANCSPTPSLRGSVSESSDESSDETVQCEDGEQFPHEDCTKYYLCIDGQLVEQSCAWGLRYHAEDEKCTFMFLVDC